MPYSFRNRNSKEKTNEISELSDSDGRTDSKCRKASL